MTSFKKDEMKDILDEYDSFKLDKKEFEEYKKAYEY